MCLQGAVSGIGTNVSAGLPNINGMISTYDGLGAFNSPSGAFDVTSNTSWVIRGVNERNAHFKLLFNASRSNAIYGASTTVQPPALKVAVLIKHD